jgi:hypothetical protein
MPAKVNLDALIPREDFEVKTEGIGTAMKTNIQIAELAEGEFFYGALRKPDFQRETGEWTPPRVLGLIKSFVDGDLIPAVILWKNHDLNFVIDGSHRLSALIAWVHDDYGDGERSQKFFGFAIPDEQVEIGERTRRLVESKFGPYRDHKEAMLRPNDFSPETKTRAYRFASIGLELQWVKAGDSAKAEESFTRINQQAAMISPQELELLKSRKKPNAIAARAIVRRGTGHKYWLRFDDARQSEIEDIAKGIHGMLFEPPLHYPLKSLQLSVGGKETAATALRMVFDLINLCVDTPSDKDDPTGERTVEYLRTCRRVMRLFCSNDASSLGLHPAVYLYSWTGKQSPVQFLVLAELVVDLNRTRRLDKFTDVRADFESFLVDNRTLLNQVVRKFGTKSSGTTHIAAYYRDVLDLLWGGTAPQDIAAVLMGRSRYNYLQPDESFIEGASGRGFSSQVKSGIIIRDLMPTAARCAQCGGYLPAQAISLDHKQRIEDGGSSASVNAQLMHPYCNTGYKEKKASQAKRTGT